MKTKNLTQRRLHRKLQPWRKRSWNSQPRSTRPQHSLIVHRAALAASFLKCWERDALNVIWLCDREGMVGEIRRHHESCTRCQKNLLFLTGLNIRMQEARNTA